MFLLEARRHKTDRVFRTRGERACGTRTTAREMIKDDTLADVRTTDDSDDKKRVVRQLRDELASQ